MSESPAAGSFMARVPANRAFVLRETPLSAIQQAIERANCRVEFVATVADSACLDWCISTPGEGVYVKKQAF
jgi:hypothetical protein